MAAAPSFLRVFRLCSLVVLALLCAVRAQAQVPSRLEDIPVYPGAVPAVWAEEFEKQLGTTLREEFNGLVLVSRVARHFEVSLTQAQILGGELLNFYVARLRPTRLSRSATVPIDPPGKVYCVVEPEGAAFTWYVKGGDGRLTRLSVSLSPGGTDASGTHRMPFTTMSETYASASTVKTAAPGEKELGYPVYPNSTFAPTESSRGPAGSTFVFFTNDAIEKVRAFFETALGIKAGKGEPSPGRVSYWFQRAPGLAYNVDHVALEQDYDGATGHQKTKISYILQPK